MALRYVLVLGFMRRCSIRVMRGTCFPKMASVSNFCEQDAAIIRQTGLLQGECKKETVSAERRFDFVFGSGSEETDIEDPNEQLSSICRQTLSRI